MLPLSENSCLGLRNTDSQRPQRQTCFHDWCSRKPLPQLHIAQSEEGLKLLQETTVLKSYSPIAWVLTKRCLHSIYYGWKEPFGKKLMGNQEIYSKVVSQEERIKGKSIFNVWVKLFYFKTTAILWGKKDCPGSYNPFVTAISISCSNSYTFQPCLRTKQRNNQ